MQMLPFTDYSRSHYRDSEDCSVFGARPYISGGYGNALEQIGVESGSMEFLDIIVSGPFASTLLRVSLLWSYVSS